MRPHDLDLLIDPTDGAGEAMIERVVYLGFEVRVELVLPDGGRVWAQVPSDQAERQELAAGQIIYMRPTTRPAFEATSDGQPATEPEVAPVPTAVREAVTSRS